MTSKQDVRVTCPWCKWRIMDKVTVTSGVIEVKCPHCRKVVRIDLALRRMCRSYR